MQSMGSMMQDIIVHYSNFIRISSLDTKTISRRFQTVPTGQCFAKTSDFFARNIRFSLLVDGRQRRRQNSVSKIPGYASTGTQPHIQEKSNCNALCLWHELPTRASGHTCRSMTRQVGLISALAKRKVQPRYKKTFVLRCSFLNNALIVQMAGRNC